MRFGGVGGGCNPAPINEIRHIPRTGKKLEQGCSEEKVGYTVWGVKVFAKCVGGCDNGFMDEKEGLEVVIEAPGGSVECLELEGPSLESRPHLFEKGEDPKRYIPGKSEVRPLGELAPVEDDGATEQLRDMRHVYRNEDKRHDKTAGQKRMREYLKKSGDAFHRRFSALEREHREFMEVEKKVARELLEEKRRKRREVREKEEGKEVERDDGMDRCLEMAEGLLVEVLEGKGG